MITDNINIGGRSVNPDGSIRVTPYSKSDPLLIDYLNKIEVSTTTTVLTVKGAYTITVANATGIVAGKYIYLYNATQGFLYFGTVLSVATNTLTMDNPINEVFNIGSNVDSAIINMNVNGSVTPQSFRLRGEGSDNLFLSFVVNRILIYMETTNPVSLDLFGDLTALTKGCVLRVVNTRTNLITNLKNNGNISAVAYDTQYFSAANPVLGKNGLVGRLTFGGNEKIGSCIKLSRTEDLEILIQDDLTGLEKFFIITEGYITEERALNY